MIPEIKNNDIKEIKTPSAENFQRIRPEKGTTIEKARSFWNDVFGKPADLFREKIQEISRTPERITTINEKYEGKRHPDTGVKYQRKIVDLPDGHCVEGVFPKFDSVFDVKLPENLCQKPEITQNKECNRQLLKAIETNPRLKKKFSEEQIEQIRDGIKDGTAPDGYVWHHNEKVGKMELVDADIHAKTRHTGGNCLWGPKSVK